VIRAILRRKSGCPVVVLGLGDENMRRLMLDQPIRVNLRSLDPGDPPDPSMPDIDVVIAFDDGSLAQSLLSLDTLVTSPDFQPPEGS
jgi:hypothetical protein